MNRRFFLASAGLGLANLMIGSCAVKSVSSPSLQVRQTHVFYPPSPLPPRIQYLTTYASEADIAPPVTGSFASFIAGDATSERRLIQPYGASLYDGKLYVVDTGAAGIALFDLRNNHFSTIGGSGNGGMKKPINITIADDGSKYVCDTGRNQVLVYDQKDQFLRAIGKAGQFKPVDCAIQGDRLYVVDIEHHQVQILDKNTDMLISTFGKPGSDLGELFHPTNLAIGPSGDVFVVETSNFRVQRFSPDGRPIRTYGQIGDASGSFARPKGIAIDQEGRLFVGDAAFENIQMFDNDGQLLLTFGHRQDAGKGLSLPAAVAIDYENVDLFTKFAAPGFNIEFIIMVVSQFGPNKVDLFGFGQMSGMDYSPQAPGGHSAHALRSLRVPFGGHRRA